MISVTTKLPVGSRINVSPESSTQRTRSSLAARRTSSSRLSGLFLLVRERTSSVSANEAIWAGVKWRRVRGTRRYRRLRRPCGVGYNFWATAVIDDMRLLARSLVSLEMGK